VSEKDVKWKISSRIFPWYARAFECVRLLLGGDPFTAEYQFVSELADSSSLQDIEECFFSYRTDLNKRGRIFLWIFGLSPRRRRVLLFYRHLKANNIQATGEEKVDEHNRSEI
jgi:hypothetical protein